MSRRLTTIVALTLVALILSTPAMATDTGKKFHYSGVYSAWFQSQRNFQFGASDYNDNYTVQMLRLKLSFDANEYLTAVTRFDIGQGWWGVDNADRTVDRAGGRVPGSGSQLFDFKDTNFLMHVDQAYALLRLADMRLHVRIGRINYSLGSKLLLDNNLDGIQADWENRIFLNYAKVSEGIDGLSDNKITDDTGKVLVDGGDAHMLDLIYKSAFKKLDYQIFGMYYIDDSYHDGVSYLPNNLNYFRSRFAPMVTDLWTFGLTANLKDKDNGWTGTFEADLLFGKDDVQTTDGIIRTTIDARQMNDINNGDLTGYNIYAKLNNDLSQKFNIGAIFGMGSGDDDVTSGDGNINKLRTSGFFYVTEVWEDSIMPDEEGITPQGLGAPNIRGYRELENTTLFQFNALWRFHPSWKLFGSYTYLSATQAVHGWHVDNNGTPDDATDDFTVIDPESSSTLGQEIDGRLDYQVVKNLTLTWRGGVFMPDDGAGFLILGNNNHSVNAWESKFMVTVKF